MSEAAANCKGCICVTCIKSEYNGAVYACVVKPCKGCNAANQLIKRAYCDSCVVKDSGLSADDLRL
jgi:hypothetical protein